MAVTGPNILILPSESRALLSVSGSRTRYLVLTVLLRSLDMGLLIKLCGKGSVGRNRSRSRLLVKLGDSLCKKNGEPKPITLSPDGF